MTEISLLEKIIKDKNKKMTQRSLANLRNKGYEIFSISETGREIGLIRTNY